MKKNILLFIIPFFLSVFILGKNTAFSQDTNVQELQSALDSIIPSIPERERILKFHADIDIDSVGTTTITETIVVYSKHDDLRHGIYRTLPRYRNINRSFTLIKYDILSIKRNGESEPYFIEKDSQSQTIYVGTTKDYMDYGINTYEIKYSTTKQIGFFNEYDEFYWNVNGNDWEFDIDTISAIVNLPEKVEAIQNSCYTGRYKSTAQNCTSEWLNDHQIKWEAYNLRRKEGLSIAVGFKKGAFPSIGPPHYLKDNYTDSIGANSTYFQRFYEDPSVTKRVYNERIINFHADIQLDTTGDLEITETIVVKAQGYRISRGIYRALPLSRKLNEKLQRTRYEVISITKDGKEETYNKKKGGNHLLLYIGDKNRYLDADIYVYEIKYKVKNQIGFFEDFDELYWNVNGLDWEFNIDTISATVTLPEQIEIIQNSCYTGAYGSTDQSCFTIHHSSNKISWYTYNLRSREGLTVAVGFKKNVIFPPPPPTFFQKHGVALFLLGFLIWFIVVCFNRWRKYGVDPIKPVITPQYFVPNNMSPLAMSYLKKEKFDNQVIGASLIHLAVLGYIKINEVKTSSVRKMVGYKIFKLEKLKPADNNISSEEAALMNGLFGTKDSILINGKYQSSIYIATNAAKLEIEKKYLDLLSKERNFNKIIGPFGIMIAVFLLSLLVNGIITGQPEDSYLSIVAGLILGVATLIVAFIVNTVQPYKGCIWAGLKIIGICLVLSFMAIMIEIMISSEEIVTVAYKWGNLFIILSFIIFILFAYLIKRPSKEKYELQSLIDGFEMYLKAAEEKMVQFENPPKLTPKIFEEFLPYAIVLGVQNIWGKKFNSLIQKSGIQYESNWYNGVQTAALSRGFYNSLNSSLTRSFTASSTYNSSSHTSFSSGGGSSFSSGSSGGGFSGGGGGGGGGGGW